MGKGGHMPDNPRASALACVGEGLVFTSLTCADKEGWEIW